MAQFRWSLAVAVLIALLVAECAAGRRLKSMPAADKRRSFRPRGVGVGVGDETPPIPGAVPCLRDEGIYALWCLNVSVPLDHHNNNTAADGRRLRVWFMVHPATDPGRKRGALVIAMGGPGMIAHIDAQWQLEQYDPELLETFDVVFFDQRGVGWSCGMYCPNAGVAFASSEIETDTPEDEKLAKASCRTFATDCKAELGKALDESDGACDVDGSGWNGAETSQQKLEAVLPFTGTAQAVEDLHIFMDVLSPDKPFWMYGKSYGTQFAQTYAVQHGDRLQGVVLDCAVDLSLKTHEYTNELMLSLANVTAAIESWCTEQPECAKDVCKDGNCTGVFERAWQKLSHSARNISFPTPMGTLESREITVSMLDLLAQSMLYDGEDRMSLLRALGAAELHEDFVPIMRWSYVAMGINETDETPDEEASYVADYSEASYYAINCQDYFIEGTTANASADERASTFLSRTSQYHKMPFATVSTAEMICAYWQNDGGADKRPALFTGTNMTTFVMTGQLDPATPHAQSKRIFGRLEDGYLLTQNGGGHPVYTWYGECLDGPLNTWLFNGTRPSQRESVCDGDAVTAEYVARAPRKASAFSDLLEALASADTEMHELPEFLWWWWSWEGAHADTGCHFGGTVQALTTADGTNYTFANCSFSKGLRISGVLVENYDADDIGGTLTLDGEWTGTAEYRRNITGTFLLASDAKRFIGWTALGAIIAAGAVVLLALVAGVVFVARGKGRRTRDAEHGARPTEQSVLLESHTPSTAILA